MGYTCSRHTSSSFYQAGRPRARHQTREEPDVHRQYSAGTLPNTLESPSDDTTSGPNGPVHEGKISLPAPESFNSEFEAQQSTELTALQSIESDFKPTISEHLLPALSSPELVTRLTAFTALLGHISCPFHPFQAINNCPRECSWKAEEAVNKGTLTCEFHASHEQQIRSGRRQIRSNPRSLINGLPAESTNIEMQISESVSGTARSTDEGEQEPNPSQRISTTIAHDRSQARKPRLASFIKPCYVLICFGIITVVGSLAPALWRATIRDDISGAFSLAQYILGVGIFAVGSMVAIHSKTCECWQTHSAPEVSHHGHV